MIGNVAEVIVLDRLLAPEDEEWGNIESYLLKKYFSGSGSGRLLVTTKES